MATLVSESSELEGRPASSRLAAIAGLAFAPWLLFALLMPTGTASWVGFGLDSTALLLLAACRTRALPLAWPRIVSGLVGLVALSSVLRFLVLPLWPEENPGLGGEPTLEAFGARLQSSLDNLAALSGLHLVATAALIALLLLAVYRSTRV